MIGCITTIILVCFITGIICTIAALAFGAGVAIAVIAKICMTLVGLIIFVVLMNLIIQSRK